MPDLPMLPNLCDYGKTRLYGDWLHKRLISSVFEGNATRLFVQKQLFFIMRLLHKREPCTVLFNTKKNQLLK